MSHHYLSLDRKLMRVLHKEDTPLCNTPNETGPQRIFPTPQRYFKLPNPQRNLEPPQRNLINSPMKKW